MARQRGAKYQQVDSALLALVRNECRSSGEPTTTVARRVVHGCLELDANCLSALSCFFPTTPPDDSDIGLEPGPQSGLLPIINLSGELRAWCFRPTLETVKRYIGSGTEDSIVRRLLRRLEREPLRVRKKLVGTLPSALPRGYVRLDSRRGRRPTRKN
jgi:hypothetical protein